MDRSPLATCVLRGGRYVYVNDAMLELLGTTRESVLGQPVASPAPVEERELIERRHRDRLEHQPVPDSYQANVQRDDGTRRRTQVYISREGEDVIVESVDITAAAGRQVRLQQLASLGASLQVAQPAEEMFAQVMRGLLALDLPALRLRPEGDGLRVTAVSLPQTFLDGAAARGLSPVDLPLGPWGPAAQTAWKDGVAFIDDMIVAAERFAGVERALPMRGLMQQAGLERSAIVRIDRGGAPSELLMMLGSWPQPEDVPAFRLFGAQITAAVEGSRLIGDLSRRNAELAALNRLALQSGQSIAAGDLFAAATREICGALRYDGVSIHLVDTATDEAVLSYAVGGTDEADRTYGRTPLKSSVMGQVASSGLTRVVLLEEYPVETQGVLRRMGFDQVVMVPLHVHSRSVGVMNCALKARRAISEQEIEVLQAMGSHLAAAVENTRLVRDLRQSYVELFKAQEQLVQRERLAALGELAAAVAHEVRNPLGVLFNSLTSLRRMVKLDGDPAQLVDIMSEEAQRLNRIIGDLLDFARPSTPTFEKADVGEVVRNAVAAALSGAKSALAVQWNITPGLPPVLLDQGLMRQAVINLVQNALQAMHGEGKLTVTVGQEQRDGAPAIYVEIADTGPGIPPGTRERMFEPFFTTKATGTGLGLAIVRRVVNDHHGWITVANQADAGARLRIAVPVQSGSNR